MALDWGRSDVVEVMERYKNKDGVDGVKSLRELRALLGELTGVRVNISTLSRRASGLAIHNGIGRPRTRPRDTKTPSRPYKKKQRVKSPSPEIEMSVSPEPYEPPPTLVRQENMVQSPYLTLSKRLTESLLVVPVGNGMVRRFRKTGQGGPQNRVSYFRCSTCSTLRRKTKFGSEAFLTIFEGRILKRPIQHHPYCHPVPETSVVAQAVDRKCRLDIKMGRLEPMEAWKQGRDKLRKITKEMHAPETLEDEFPPWENVRTQYCRQQKKTFLSQEDAGGSRVQAGQPSGEVAPKRKVLLLVPNEESGLSSSKMFLVMPGNKK